MKIYRITGIFLIGLIFMQAVKINNVDASFWDGVFGVSQLKSVTQFMLGRKKSAVQTQKNFLNQMVGVSQVKSLVHVINKDFKKARRTQKIFYDEMVEPLLDNTPVIGHAKAMIHLMSGNTRR